MEGNLLEELDKAREQIRFLQVELEEADSGLVALNLELELRVERRTEEIYKLKEELEETNKGLLALALELEDRVDKRTKELRTYQENLEEMVRERTLELEVSNRKLQQEINEREQAERMVNELNLELQQRVQDLETLNNELDSFSYSVSHDLRAPLRAIDGFTQILKEDCFDRLDDEGKRNFDIIQMNAKRMGALIDDLLSFSRLGRQHISKAQIDMAGLARAVYEEEAHYRCATNLKVKIGDLPPAMGDYNMMAQVLANLFSNAIKYSRHKKEAIIEMGFRSENGLNTYFIRDNGAGFDMKHAGKLFGVFQRLHRMEEFEGTGVGLAIIKRIITRHGGTVWAEGKEGEGATFYFTLPDSQEKDTSRSDGFSKMGGS